MDYLLQVHGLTKYFGGIAALSALDFNVKPREILGLIGPNGAGKSTVFNLITGYIKPTRGKVFFFNEEITGLEPHVIAKKGIGRTFQLAHFFPEFNVLENVLVSLYLSSSMNPYSILFNTKGYVNKEKSLLREAERLLEFVGLIDKKNVLAKHLPHGHQKVLNIARALAIKPKLLLLDEPVAGMTRDEISFFLKVFERLREEGITIVLVEHNLEFVSICDRIIVLNFGVKIAEGPFEEISKDEKVIKAYLGSDYAT